MQNARGFDAKQIIVDEACFVPESLINEAILPVARQEETGLVLISTPLGENHFFQRLESCKNDHGEHIFHSVRLSRLCEACKLRPTSEGFECTHMQHRLPIKEFSEKAKDVNCIYKGGNENVARRDLMGIPTDDEQPMFPRKLLCGLFGDPPLDLEDAPRPEEWNSPPRFCPAPMGDFSRVFIMCDPNAGGNSSLSMTVGLLVDSGRLVVIGLCEFKCSGSASSAECMREIIRHLRNDQRYAAAALVIGIEGLLGNEAENIQGFLSTADEVNAGLGPMQFMKGFTNGRFGLPKTQAITQKFVDIFQHNLNIQSISFSEDMFIINSVVGLPGAAAGKTYVRKDALTYLDTFSESQFVSKQYAMIAYLRDQFSRFRKILASKIRTDGDVPKFTITGKTGTKEDDLAISMLMFSYWAPQAHLFV